jgi:hypothetical protein
LGAPEVAQRRVLQKYQESACSRNIKRAWVLQKYIAQRVRAPEVPGERVL